MIKFQPYCKLDKQSAFRLKNRIIYNYIITDYKDDLNLIIKYFEWTNEKVS